MHSGAAWGGDAEAFGAGAAILLGDLCLAWSDEMLSRSGVDSDALQRARPVFDLMRTEVIAGQYLDVHAQATGDTSLQRASTVARYKSAKYTVERPLLLGAALADDGAPVRSAYSAYGLPLGQAFQLRDDVLGVFGDPAATGKPAGDDLREGKRTYLVASAFAAADAAQRSTLERGLGDRGLDAAGVDELRSVIVRTGALDRTEERIAQLTETALAALGQARLEPEASRMLSALARAATRRSL
jgi:geranylgeranyl diphosphate synthase type I